MKDLVQLRAEIDDIDAQMVALFEKRMDVTRQVGEYKKAHDLPVLDRNREAEVLAKKEAMLKNPYLKTEVKDFFGSIMAISRRQQRHSLGKKRKNITGKSREFCFMQFLIHDNTSKNDKMAPGFPYSVYARMRKKETPVSQRYGGLRHTIK